MARQPGTRAKSSENGPERRRLGLMVVSAPPSPEVTKYMGMCSPQWSRPPEASVSALLCGPSVTHGARAAGPQSSPRRCRGGSGAPTCMSPRSPGRAVASGLPVLYFGETCKNKLLCHCKWPLDGIAPGPPMLAVPP